MQIDLAYARGRQEQLAEFQSVLHSSIEKYEPSTSQGIVKVYNDLVQFLYLEESRWSNERMRLLEEAIYERREKEEEVR